MTQRINDSIVKSMYLEGLSYKEVSNILKCNPSTVYAVLKRNNISPRQPKYDVNDSYFDNIDTQDRAYFLGLIYADGSLTNKTVLDIQLMEEDGYILEELKNKIEYTGPLYLDKKNERNEKWKNMRQLCINRKALVESLKTKGLTYRKSLILTFPSQDIVSDEFLPHFIRGYFDGDGCISKSRIVSIVSTYMFLEKMVERIPFELNYSLYDRTKTGKTTRELRIGKKAEQIKFLDYIYQNSTIHLNRKYERYLALKGV